MARVRSSSHTAAWAVKLLESKTATKSEKEVAASALTQITGVKSIPSKKVAETASAILRNPKSSKDAKSAAASALTQRPQVDAKRVKSKDVYRAVGAYFAKKKA
jgi:hypothetical protein